MDMLHIQKAMAHELLAQKQAAKARSREGRSTQNGREEQATLRHTWGVLFLSRLSQGWE